MAKERTYKTIGLHVTPREYRDLRTAAKQAGLPLGRFILTVAAKKLDIQLVERRDYTPSGN